MQPLQTTSIAASLALLLLPTTTHAQSNTSNQNITIRFFPTTQDTCSYTNTTSALTFTTSSIPILSHCFDFASLFSGNSTQGFVNQTENQGSTVWGEAGIHWQLFNAETFDPQTNYSGILYRQHVTNPTDDDDKPGQHADRRVTLYGAKKCRESDGQSELLPWYGFDCWSENEGSCGTLPYGIVSFSVQPQQDEEQGTCWVFAERGAAASVGTSSRGVVAVVVSTFMAVWLAL
jgi:hypothetical protein